MRDTNTLFIILILMSAFNGCHKDDLSSRSLGKITSVASPAGEGSGEANLFATDDGRVLLSWIEPGIKKQHSLRFSVWETEGWSQSQIIAEGDHWFVNWADFPSLISMSGDWLAAHWLAKSGEGTYAYDVNIVQSSNAGKSWHQPIVPHDDGTPTEHGFVSLLPWNDTKFLAVWLDGRNFSKHAGHSSAAAEMSLRAAFIDQKGTLTGETVLDSRVCDCCQTSAVRTANGAIVSYRDRSENEIRDISAVRFEKGQWSSPYPVYEDGWEINGCPVNGPSLAAAEKRVAVAWFTEANQTPRVKVGFSNDEGQTFGEPVIVDDGHPIGRVDAVMLPDGGALVSWVEKIETAAEIRIRYVQQNGTTSPSRTVAKTSLSRASGFPQMAYSNGQIYIAWTVPGQPSFIRTAVSKLIAK